MAIAAMVVVLLALDLYFMKSTAPTVPFAEAKSLDADKDSDEDVERSCPHDHLIAHECMYGLYSKRGKITLKLTDLGQNDSRTARLDDSEWPVENK
jgi:hypothetical protein